MSPEPTNWRARALQGIAWNSLFQVFQGGLGFAVMIVLVHVVPPVEYGRFAAVTGLTGLINIGSCGAFMTQALQLPDGVTPDWNQHFSAGVYIQSLLTVLCWTAAGACWMLPAYRPLAPLLLISSLNFIFDVFNLMGDMMLRRELDFRRLRIVHAVGTLASMLTSLLLGLRGFGAYAFIIANVFNALPFTLDLLLLRGWRPRAGWWRMPDWKQYGDALQFGVRQGGAALLSNARRFAESLVLPASVGLVAMGLWNRAQGLFRSSVGRVIPLLLEALYPVLPRYAADRQQYPRQATLVVQVMAWTVIPLGILLGAQGPLVSRLLYGQKWIAADPLLWPGALVGIGFSLFSVSYIVLLAANRLKTCTRLDLVSGLLLTSAIVIPWLGSGMVVYTWVVAAAQLAAAAAALVHAGKFMSPGWHWTVLAPPAVAAATAAFFTHWAAGLLHMPLFSRLLTVSGCYAITVIATLRFAFSRQTRQLVERLPLLRRLQFLLLFPKQSSAAGSAS